MGVLPAHWNNLGVPVSLAFALLAGLQVQTTGLRVAK
jgi:hypothetical protein